MIRYTLKCAAGHRFESWFQNAGAFAALQAGRQLACVVCGGTEVDKDLMAPSLRPTRKTDAQQPEATAPNLRDPASDLEAAIAALRKQIAENSEYVGMNFATEARAIHEGLAPERSIHGEAGPEDARKMMEDGLPVAPLPFMPGRKVN